MAAKAIITGTDGSEESLRAVEWAAREAVLRHEVLRIVSAPVLPPRMSPDPAGRNRPERLTGKALAMKAVDGLEASGVVCSVTGCPTAGGGHG